MTDSLTRKPYFGQTIGKGFEGDVHGVVGAPRESLVRVLKAEDGGYGGEKLWRPARLGLRPGYESDLLKKYVQGGFAQA